MAEKKNSKISGKESPSGSSFLSRLGTPARNALLHNGIDTLEKLSAYSEKEILKIHGIGPASLPVMKMLLAEAGLTFNNN